MVQTQFGLEYFDGPAIERLGLIILALGLKHTGEVIVADCNVGMILAERLFTDLHRPPSERLGLVILALGPKQFGEVTVTRSNVGMIFAENLFSESIVWFSCV